MNGKVNVYYAKGVFKSAVAVGAGLTVGKYLGGLINAGFEGVGRAFLSIRAKRGSEQAQEFCKKHNIEYEKPEQNKESEVRMGFHV